MPPQDNTEDRLKSRPAEGYAGDVTPELAWQWVQDGSAVLIDIRTDAEREWVGFVPGAITVPWNQWPGRVKNEKYAEQVREAAGGRKAVLLCRSGNRSIPAARSATEAGVEAYNILEGFEGDADADGHRGTHNGWRFRGLPWKQN